MKRNWIKSIASLIILLSLANVVFAGDSLSLSISCTIPVIPGVNAPLIEQETSKTVETAAQPKAKPEERIQPQTPTMIQEDSQEEKTASDGQKSAVIVKTIYSR